MPHGSENDTSHSSREGVLTRAGLTTCAVVSVFRFRCASAFASALPGSGRGVGLRGFAHLCSQTCWII